MSLDEPDHPDVIEIAGGFDISALEIMMARLRGDGIPARLEPDDTGIIPDNPYGYLILLHKDDLEAAADVLRAAGVDPEPLS